MRFDLSAPNDEPLTPEESRYLEARLRQFNDGPHPRPMFNEVGAALTPDEYRMCMEQRAAFLARQREAEGG